MNRFTSLLKDAVYHINKIDNDSALNPQFRQMYEQQRVQLLRAVSRAVKQVQLEHASLSASTSDENEIIIRSGKPTFQLCSCCEIVLRHGLKESVLHFGGKPSFWSLAKQVSRKEAIEYINSLDQAKSDLGRCRAWLRLAINENSLQSYITTILNDVSLIKYYYDLHAFVLDVDKAEAMAMMISGIANFNFDMPINTAALEYEPTPLAQMWGSLAKTSWINKESRTTGGGGRAGQKVERVRKKRVARRTGGNTAEGREIRQVEGQHNQEEILGQPSDMTRELSEDTTSLASSSAISNEQFADEERWFREMMDPDTESLGEEGKKFEMTPLEELNRERVMGNEFQNETDLSDVTRATDDDCFSTDATAVSEEPNDLTELEVKPTKQTESVTEILDLTKQDDDDVNREKSDACPGYESNDNNLGLVAGQQTEQLDLSCSSKLDNETQVQTFAETDGEKEEVDKGDSRNEERDVTFSPEAVLEAPTLGQTGNVEEPFPLLTDKVMSELGGAENGQLTEDGNETADELAVETCEDEDMDSQTRSDNVKTDETNVGSGVAFDAFLSSGVATVEHCKPTTMVAADVTPATVSQFDNDRDSDKLLEASHDEGNYPEGSPLETVGQNNLNRYLSWNNDAIDQSVPERRLQLLDIAKANESDETVTEVIVSPYGDRQSMLLDHFTSNNGSHVVEHRKDEQVGDDDSECDDSLEDYDILPELPDTDIRVTTQSEAIGAELKATIKELDLSDKFDMQRLIGFEDDHFSQPELLGPNATIEELIQAVSNRVSKFKASHEMLDEGKQRLVMEIVQLRLQIQELVESGGEGPTSKVVLGHRLLRKRKSPGIKRHCDHCKMIIWCIIQTWYQCEGCKYSCHRKCLSSVSRSCPLTKVTDSKLCTDICPEHGLSNQKYKCMECRRKISFQPRGGVSEARLCDYTGYYYCDNCHWNDTHIVPARIIHNWDFSPQKVCRQAKQVVSMTVLHACLNIQQLNPLLFNYVTELAEMRKLREEMLVMKKYFLSCRTALECGLLNLLQERQHFKESSDIYSLQDLVDLASGVLISEITDIHRKFALHIRNDCHRCQGKGFFCEICRADHVIFHFDIDAGMCAECSTVYHRACLNSNQCPKCLRLAQRKKEYVL